MILSNCQYIHPISCECLAKRTSSADISSKRIWLYFLYKVVEVSVSKRITICEINLVSSVGECMLPWKCVERLVLICTFTITILVILYILTASMPRQIFLFRFLHRVDNNLHPALVQTVMFVKVKYIKLGFHRFSRVRHFKKKPLGVAVRINIIL